MMTFADIESAVRATLADSGQRREHYTTLEIQGYTWEAERQVVTIKPWASAKDDHVHQCEPTAMQRLSSDVHMMLEMHGVIENGKVVRQIHRIERKDADLATPGWMSEQGPVDEYIEPEPERGDPTVFWLMPHPVDNSQSLSMTVSMLPTRLENDTDALTVTDRFGTAVVEWVLYRCLSKHHKEGNSPAAGHHYQQFYTQLGEKVPQMTTMPKYEQKRREGYVRG